MTYSINGIPLDNPAVGWEVVRGSIPVMGYENSAPTSESWGRDGSHALPGTRTSASLQLLIKHTNATRSDLYNLMTEPELTLRDSERPEWFAKARLLTATPEKFYGHKDWGVDLFVLSVPRGTWRAAVVTSILTPAAPAGATHTIFSGISAPVQDALVRLKGPIQNAQVLDSRGSFVTFKGTIAAGQYGRFDMATGRAWLTTTDTWSGGTEISGEVDYGGPRGIFELTPKLVTPTDPSDRVASVILNQTTYGTGSGIQIRGSNATLF